MLILVKKLGGKTFSFEVEEGETITSLKQKIEASPDGTPAWQQRLIYAGKELTNEKRFCDYSIGSEATIHLLINLKATPPPGYTSPSASTESALEKKREECDEKTLPSSSSSSCGNGITVYVNHPCGKTTTVGNLNPAVDTIRTIKERIFKLDGIKVYDQILASNWNMNLNDASIIISADIGDEASLSLRMTNPKKKCCKSKPQPKPPKPAPQLITAFSSEQASFWKHLLSLIFTFFLPFQPYFIKLRGLLLPLVIILRTKIISIVEKISQWICVQSVVVGKGCGKIWSVGTYPLRVLWSQIKIYLLKIKMFYDQLFAWIKRNFIATKVWLDQKVDKVIEVIAPKLQRFGEWLRRIDLIIQHKIALWKSSNKQEKYPRLYALYTNTSHLLTKIWLALKQLKESIVNFIRTYLNRLSDLFYNTFLPWLRRVSGWNRFIEWMNTAPKPKETPITPKPPVEWPRWNAFKKSLKQLIDRICDQIDRFVKEVIKPTIKALQQFLTPVFGVVKNIFKLLIRCLTPLFRLLSRVFKYIYNLFDYRRGIEREGFILDVRPAVKSIPLTNAVISGVYFMKDKTNYQVAIGSNRFSYTLCTLKIDGKVMGVFHMAAKSFYILEHPSHASEKFFFHGDDEKKQKSTKIDFDPEQLAVFEGDKGRIEAEFQPMLPPNNRRRNRQNKNNPSVPPPASSAPSFDSSTSTTVGKDETDAKEKIDPGVISGETQLVGRSNQHYQSTGYTKFWDGVEPVKISVRLVVH